MSYTAADVLAAAFSFLAAFVFLRHFWWTFAVDKLRQDLFAVRDALFDAALSGRHGFGFNSPVYKAQRESLNARIYYADQAHFIRIVLYWALARRRGIRVPQSSRMPAASQEARAYMAGVEREAGEALIRFYWVASPLFVCMASVVIPALLIRRVLGHIALRRSLARKRALVIAGTNFQAEEAWKLREVHRDLQPCAAV